ncbi:B12-binding domain-containing radical SAM protein [bacterium]|nr:B12-binding domain-containing radical SAM protein [bacterium]
MSAPTPHEIVLVQPGPHRMQLGGALLHLPLALMSLAAWLRRDERYGDCIRILDMHIHKPDPSMFERARIVGITAMTGQQVYYGLQAAAMVRRVNPKAIIVWGGVHPTLMYEQTIRHEFVDVVVSGEGEDTFKDVVDAVFSGVPIEGIPGTCVKDGNGGITAGPERELLDMNDLPLPAYDLVDIHDYSGIEFQFDYQSSRGCPFRCGFCYNTVFSGRRWRAKNPVKVAEELAYLQKRHAVKNFAMADDEFFIDTRRIETLFGDILERGLRFGIVASCRLDIIRKFSPESLAIMKKAGVFQLFFGAESGSETTLSLIRKDITVNDIIEGARRVAEAGIRPILSFMSGFPGETFEQFGQTLDTIERLRKTHPLITVNGVFPFNAYPGTELFCKSREMGLKTPETLDAWGSWNFQYEPDNPWLDRRMKQWMQISFYIVRFRYYLARYGDRHGNGFRVRLVRLLSMPLTLSARIRWSKRWFGFAWEWRLFAFMVRKTFGYL